LRQRLLKQQLSSIKSEEFEKAEKELEKVVYDKLEEKFQLVKAGKIKDYVII